MHITAFCEKRNVRIFQSFRLKKKEKEKKWGKGRTSEMRWDRSEEEEFIV